jgi:glutamine synthetase
MAAWVAVLLEHAKAMSLLGGPTVNGPKRIRPYTFAPTHVHWGLDNRSVLARCIVDAGSSANRMEFRSAGADANPYLLIAGILAAGCDGIERSLELLPTAVGDTYANPGVHTPLPTDLAGAIDAYEGSPLAGMLGDTFSRSFVSLAREEVRLAAEHNSDHDEVNDWERSRYIEFS